jgi:hypothetical protein
MKVQLEVKNGKTTVVSAKNLESSVSKTPAVN